MRIVTCALPYANGDLHLGHLLEYLMADVHVRTMRAVGEDIVFVCADDTHGTPIEIAARSASRRSGSEGRAGHASMCSRFIAVLLWVIVLHRST